MAAQGQIERYARHRTYITWANLVLQASNLVGVDASRLEARQGYEMNFAARRPAYSARGSMRASLLPSLNRPLSRRAQARHARVRLLTTRVDGPSPIIWIWAVQLLGLAETPLTFARREGKRPSYF